LIGAIDALIGAVDAFIGAIDAFIDRVDATGIRVLGAANTRQRFRRIGESKSPSKPLAPDAPTFHFMAADGSKVHTSDSGRMDGRAREGSRGDKDWQEVRRKAADSIVPEHLRRKHAR
jgi:hypothetical protein